MKITIIGLPQAGQQELFSILTGLPLETVRQKQMEVQQGICEVKDPRIDRLKQMYKPQKTTYARIEYVLLPDFTLQGPSKDLIISQLKNADEICWVVGLSNAETEIAAFVSELILYDLMLAEKRISSISKDKKKPEAQRNKELALIELCKNHLEQEKMLIYLQTSEEQKKELKTLQALTSKPLIFVVNAPEDSLKEHALTDKISQKYSYPCIQVSAKLEEEISRLDESDRTLFMQELGIEESALSKMTHIAYKNLGLISFFTVGEDEVRAWTTYKNATAPQAAASIHSDIEKGFVRAEMFKYEDLISAGSEVKLKELGKYHLKGRDYTVEDGDILSFRSSL